MIRTLRKLQLRTSSFNRSVRKLSTTPSAVASISESWRKNVRDDADAKLLQGERQNWWWTGKAPSQSNLAEISPTSSYISSFGLFDLTTTKELLQREFDNVWTLTETLFSTLQGEEAFYKPAYHHLRHPMIFYYGHPAVFYTNKLKLAGAVDGPLDEHLEHILEVGVDEMQWDDISMESRDWPTVMEVHSYRQRIYKIVSDIISELPEGTLNINWENDKLWAIIMAIEHDKIHQETSSVLFREIEPRLLKKSDKLAQIHPSIGLKAAKSGTSPTPGTEYPQNQFLSVQGRTVEVGKGSQTSPRQNTYGWDNEYGVDVRTVSDFQCSKYAVSNGEFLEFIEADGYLEKKYWTEQGWGWRSYRDSKFPSFWLWDERSLSFNLRTIYETVPLPWNVPVIVNYHEAKAFCNWKSSQEDGEVRLIKEAEFHCMRGDSVPEESNLGLRYMSEGPVDEGIPNSLGFYNAFGNVWEWSEDVFHPLTGFKTHSLYDDFSTPCFDGEHHMILGGSFGSSGSCGAGEYCRFHFRPHFFQHAGFRYVKSVE